MLKSLVWITILTVTVLGMGCGCVATNSPFIVVAVENPYDLRVEVKDARNGGGYPGAKVRVFDTGDWTTTGIDGWTNCDLETPANSDNVTITVTFRRTDGAETSQDFKVPMRHAVTTTYTARINRRPPY